MISILKNKNKNKNKLVDKIKQLEIKLKEKKLIERKNKTKELKERLLIRLFDFYKYYAVLFNDNGEQIKIIKLDKTQNKFKYKDKSYLINYQNNTFIKRVDLFGTYKYFFYDIKTITPLQLNNSKFKHEDINPTELNALLETKVMSDLNRIGNPLSDIFKNKTLILIILGIIAFIILKNLGVF